MLNVVLGMQVYKPVRVGGGEHGPHVHGVRDRVGGRPSLRLRLLFPRRQETVDAASRQGPRGRRAALRRLLQPAARSRVPCRLPPTVQLHLQLNSR